MAVTCARSRNKREAAVVQGSGPGDAAAALAQRLRATAARAASGSSTRSRHSSAARARSASGPCSGHGMQQASTNEGAQRALQTAAQHARRACSASGSCSGKEPRAINVCATGMPVRSTNSLTSGAAGCKWEAASCEGRGVKGGEGAPRRRCAQHWGGRSSRTRGPCPWLPGPASHPWGCPLPPPAPLQARTRVHAAAADVQHRPLGVLDGVHHGLRGGERRRGN